MNRSEVILTIREVGGDFSRVIACLNEPQYINGYNQAIKDMEKMFYHAGLDADYAAERNDMMETINRLREKNRDLKQTVYKQSKLLQQLVLQSGRYCDAHGDEPSGRRRSIR